MVNIVQPDIGYIDGIARAKHVADLAADAGLPWVSHVPTRTLQKVFTLHLLATTDNTGEYPIEYQIPIPGSQPLYTPEPTLNGGKLRVPEGPG